MPNETKQTSELGRVVPKYTRMYLIPGRHDGKSMLQIEIYRRLCELSDNEQNDIVPKIMEDLIDWRETKI